MYTVYMHTNKLNSKKYIGITCQIPWQKRFNGDGSGYKNCVHFWNAIKKYGWNNFTHTILDLVKTESEAVELEKYYISLYNTQNEDFGYNIKSGGEHQTYPKEIRDRISAANKGRPSSMLGKHHSEETKRKISEAQKGRPHSPEHAENCRRATREYYKTHSPSHTFTEEDYRNAREACKIRIRIVETNQEFNSMSECADYLGVLISNLSRAIRFNKKYKGYHYEKVLS